MTLLEDISSAVQRGKKKEVKPLVQQAIDEGMDPQVILNEGLVPAMSIIGDKFLRRRCSSPRCWLPLAPCRPAPSFFARSLRKRAPEPLGKAVIGTVRATCTTSVRTLSA